MECVYCSVNGKKIVYMDDKGFDKSNAHVYECPECGREEVSGFGQIR